MHDPDSVATLVSRARDGDQQAWNAIVDRFAPLVWAVCRQFRLSDADAGDAVQTVWLRLVEHLPQLREPAALPGWMATVARRECLRIASGGNRVVLSDGQIEVAADEERTALDRGLLAAERRAVVREAFAELPTHCREILTLLMAEPAIPYAQIGVRLAIPVGSIGPTRSRCLGKLRSCPRVVSLLGRLDDEPGGGARDA
jgi:RNA polymerase sigma factor (sigma-70 family)